MNIPHTIVVMAATLSLATTTILCNDTVPIIVSAFTFSSSLPHANPSAQQHLHRGMIPGRSRRRRRRHISPSTPMCAKPIIMSKSMSSRRQLIRTNLLTSKNDDNDQIHTPSEAVDTNNPTDVLLNRARRLREEISAIELSKLQAQNEKEVQLQEKMAAEETERQQNEQNRLRYSAIVPILKDMGEEVMERVDFPPRIKGGKSYIVALQAPLPLGLILSEESSIPGLITVESLSPDGNGLNAGVQEGDILRAVTACQVTMESPTWQLLAGGIGRPKTKRFMCVVDGRPLEEVLNAVGSNRMDGLGRDVWLVLERME